MRHHNQTSPPPAGTFTLAELPRLSPPLAAPPAGLPAAAGSPANSQPPVIEPALTPALHGLTFREFEICPDGRTLAVIQPGKRNVLLYRLR